MKKILIVILLVNFTLLVGGTIVQTPEGMKVVLFDDGTWSYCENLIENNDEECDICDKYLRAIKLGGEWFLNNQNENFLYYEYYPFEKEHPAGQQTVREAASLWAIGRLSNFLGDSRYDELAQRGFLNFEVDLEYDSDNDFYYLTTINSSIAHSAFLILSLLQIDYPLKDYYLDGLARGIIFMQNENGSLNTIFGYSDTSFGIDYYPGEALLSIVSMYEYTGESKYLEVVEKAFDFYSEYWRDNQNSAFIPWHTRTYYELYLITGKKKIADFIFEMNDYLVSLCSCFGNLMELEFKGIESAVFVEGMNKAYQLAIEFNDKKREELYLNFIKKGTDFFLKLQVTGTAGFLDEKAVGGFLESPTSNLQRVDNNQHALMALMDSFEQGILGD